ncbi:FGGY-family carbohydrate kinase, partial [Maribacter sp.]|uniref:FGGY-family carbohydrate kinase n=1 Tax=Maribacter sp. TaxID=1897614 RepID=UPI003298F6D6
VEGIDKKLPAIESSNKTTLVNYKGHQINIGIGIHDSSSALVPYIRSIAKPFLLVSTGTWSISINPFNKDMLTSHDIENDSLFNMQVDGSPVKVSRLFLGNEYKIQVQALSDYYKVPYDMHKNVRFDQNIFLEINKDFTHRYKWSSMTSASMPEKTVMIYDSYEYAYHQLLLELVLLQVKSIKAAIGKSKIKQIYVDGGFSDNEVFIQMLSQFMNTIKLKTTNSSLGSALGAAIVISDKKIDSKFLKSNYAVKKHVPLILN